MKSDSFDCKIFQGDRTSYAGIEHGQAGRMLLASVDIRVVSLIVAPTAPGVL
jgi:hypothetical protein